MVDEARDTDLDVFERSSQQGEVADEGTWVALPPADLLSLEAADALLRRRPARVIAIVGERKGGKTTLVTEIYDRFLRGGFADHLFCESKSLLGFERKSFAGRAASGGEVPDTQRTSRQEGLQFFHLALAANEHLARTDLLISERAGEIYRDVREKPSLGRGFIEVARADCVAFLLDGGRIAQGRLRAEAIASVRTLARALSDEGVLGRNTRVQLVTTKIDLLHSTEAAGAREALDDFEQRFVAAHKEMRSVEAFRVAARDPSGQLEPAYGVAPLLKTWLQAPNGGPAVEARLPPLTSEFDRLLLRYGK